jgi:hypothetical protein
MPEGAGRHDGLPRPAFTKYDFPENQNSLLPVCCMQQTLSFAPYLHLRYGKSDGFS